MKIEKKDRNILRELGLRYLEITQQPRQEKLRREWTKHNDMEKVEPRVLIYPDGDGAWSEILNPGELQTEASVCRFYELILRRKIYHYENFRDDFVFEPVIHVDYAGEYTGYHYGIPNQKTAWGIEVSSHKTSVEGGAYGFKPSLNSESDLQKLLEHKLDFIFDMKTTDESVERLNDIFDGILGIEVSVPFMVHVSSLLIELVHLRGLTQMMMDLYDNPEFLIRAIDHMASSKLALVKKLELEGLLSLNNRDHYTGSGGLGYTKQLPRQGYDGKTARIRDLWGYADAQEFSDVSAEMLAQFVLPFQARILKEYGLVCYGCCEKVDKKLDMIIELPNIRRVSISPWTGIQIAAEKIGRKCIYSRKPNPAFVSSGFDAEEARKDMEAVLKAAGECNLEFILKDIRTCGRNPRVLSEWVDLAQSLCK
jgi:hypothetical protein